MNAMAILSPKRGRTARRTGPVRAFTLIELLTVMFIISLLIAILVPSLNAARNSAKKTATKSTVRSIASALDLFRAENEREFSRTNGYPPSFAHPRMGGVTFDPYRGQFPFIEQKPVITGAHWLPAMLMGFDQLGYIKRSSVPKTDNLRVEPWRWYQPDPLGTGKALARASFYADPQGLRTVRTKDLPGRPNLNEFFTEGSWEYVQHMPVIVDSFGQPILYYVANAGGRTTNMVAKHRAVDNKYPGDVKEQSAGPPYYFHEDNQAFTGNEDAAGWEFDGEHPIAYPGEELNADALTNPDTPLKERQSFARFIIDRTQFRAMENKRQEGESISESTPLRPVNADTYLLISAGVDGRYGTSDDATNFPLAAE